MKKIVSLVMLVAVLSLSVPVHAADVETKTGFIPYKELEELIAPSYEFFKKTGEIRADITKENLEEELHKYYYRGVMTFFVTDMEGAPIKDVAIKISDSEGAEIVTIKSDKDGNCAVSDLLYGSTYEYKVEKIPSKYKNVELSGKFRITLDEYNLYKRLAFEKKPVEKKVVKEKQPEKNWTISTKSDLRVPSNLTASDYDKMLKGTALAEISEALVSAEKTYQVNSLYLLGLVGWESTHGTSRYARERNNLMGYGATDSNPDGAWWFDSYSDCVLEVAKRLKSSYLTKGAKYFNGYTPEAIDVLYCSDPAHTKGVVAVAKYYLDKIGH